MPGFRTNMDSGGTLAGDNVQNIKSAVAETKRKHRWLFTVWTGDTTVGGLKRVSTYLQSAQRPHAVVEEAVMHHDQEQAYYAGKYHWEPITLVFYDLASAGGDGNSINSALVIYNWFNQVIQIPNAAVFIPADYKKNSKLEMTDGAGNSIEEWVIYNSWPIDVNWNDLDYTNTEIQTIDVSLKFDRAELVTTTATPPASPA